MKVKELKVELIKRGLPVAGLKRALVDRLKDGLSNILPLIEQMSKKSQQTLLDLHLIPVPTGKIYCELVSL